MHTTKEGFLMRHARQVKRLWLFRVERDYCCVGRVIIRTANGGYRKSPYNSEGETKAEENKKAGHLSHEMTGPSVSGWDKHLILCRQQC